MDLQWLWPSPLELTRALLDGTAELRHGFLDVLGESTSSPVPTFAQRAMNSPFVATVYERLWRPPRSTSPAASPREPSSAARHRPCVCRVLKRLLDVACGPGNFTGPLAATTAGRRPARSDSTFPSRC